MAFIDSGAVNARDSFQTTPKNKWPILAREKRDFISVNINYDCRCLVEFCQEAEIAWEELGYESSADMIRNGYELEPSQIELAVAWLKVNDPDYAISLDDVTSAVAKARANPLAGHGANQHTDEDGGGNTITSSVRGTGTDYTLRRLARDAPELLDEIEAGKLSVNQAAIKAGFRRKPTPEETCLKAFAKVQNRIETLLRVLEQLEPHEVVLLNQWILDRK